MPPVDRLVSAKGGDNQGAQHLFLKPAFLGGLFHFQCYNFLMHCIYSLCALADLFNECSCDRRNFILARREQADKIGPVAHPV